MSSGEFDVLVSAAAGMEAQRAALDVAARTVALAMLGAARSGRRGTQRYRYADILSLAEKGAARGVV